MIYMYFKAFHIIAVIAWMVSLLYLPRLFVYHSSVMRKSVTYEIFLIMEKRLLYLISLPAVLLSYMFGSYLIHENISLINETYFIIKILAILLLTIYHYYLFSIYKSFKYERNLKSSSFFKYINEIPTILMILIIILVVVKPDLG